jgi:glycerate kinase
MAPTLLAAPDKFRGTVTAGQVAAAVDRAASPLGWSVRRLPLSDGGEGLLEALGQMGGVSRPVEVEGPLGMPVTARWLRIGPTAVVEMAQASGLALVGGAGGNDPLQASTRGTGQLMVAAARGRPGEGVGPPTTLVVGLGGSATTDGGRGALEAIEESGGLGGVELIGACDVGVGFVEAAARFGPQKGADPGQVAALTTRLEAVADQYERRFGVDVRQVEGAGAAGGFGGAVVALGGRLRSGYEVVTELVGFGSALAGCELVVTGEGALDVTSFLGKVVGSVLGDAGRAGVPVLVVAGQSSADAADRVERAGGRLISLSERFGVARSMSDTAGCIERAVSGYLGGDPDPG